MHTQTPSDPLVPGEQPHLDHEAPAEPACCVALRVQVTQDRVGEDVEIVHDLPRVGIGEPTQMLRGLIEYRLEGAAREVLLAELDAVGPLDPHRPLQLARLHVDGGCAVYIEALLLPLSVGQAADLEELLLGESDPATRHELGWLYAEGLADLWRAASPEGRLPVRYLEDALVEPTAPAVPQEAAARAQAPALAAA